MDDTRVVIDQALNGQVYLLDILGYTVAVDSFHEKQNYFNIYN